MRIIYTHGIILSILLSMMPLSIMPLSVMIVSIVKLTIRRQLKNIALLHST